MGPIRMPGVVKTPGIEGTGLTDLTYVLVTNEGRFLKTGRGEQIWSASAPVTGHIIKNTSSRKAPHLLSWSFTVGRAASPSRRRGKESLLIRRDAPALLTDSEA